MVASQTDGTILLVSRGQNRVEVEQALVNLINEKRNDHILSIEDPIEVDVVGSYLSNGDGGDFGTVLRGGIGNFAWHLDGFYRDTDDYETGAGRTQNGQRVAGIGIVGEHQLRADLLGQLEAELGE